MGRWSCRRALAELPVEVAGRALPGGEHRLLEAALLHAEGHGALDLVHADESQAAAGDDYLRDHAVAVDGHAVDGQQLDVGGKAVAVPALDRAAALVASE